jgi:hypothetical protein
MAVECEDCIPSFLRTLLQRLSPDKNIDILDIGKGFDLIAGTSTSELYVG